MSRGGSGRHGSGATAGAVETELKLRISPSRLRAVLALPLLRSSRGASTRTMAATYFDTPALDLWRQRIALRVRREGGRWVQTVKGGGSVDSGVHRRLEIETVLRDANPDLAALPRHPYTAILRSRKIASALQPVVHTRITRTLRLLEPAPGVLVEAAIDHGVIRSGRRRVQVCEIELELKSGPLTALFDLAQQLAAAVPLALEQRSKAERGYALFRGRAAAPVKALPAALTREMTAGRAFRAIAAAALTQIHANAQGVIDADDPEYLHQMRVGIRRLRSALSLFRELLGDAALPHAAALRAIAGALGPARDWDVLVTETLPAAMAALPDQTVMPDFAAACAACRKASYREARKSIKTNRYNLSLLALGSWLAALPATGAWREPARTHAARMLAERHARVLKRGRHIAHCPVADLHRLRIAVKKLRYATEFFAGLFQIKDMAVQRARLERLQDILGRINDAATVEPLVAAAVAAAPGRDVAAAADSLRDWHQSRAAGERAKLQSAWRRFRAAQQPWRE